MTREEFVKSVENLQKEIMKINEVKGEDYTRGDIDALKNFKEGAEFFGMTPYQCLGVYMKKHSDAIFNYIKTGGQSESEPIRERIKDNILYLFLLNALIEETHLSIKE